MWRSGHCQRLESGLKEGPARKQEEDLGHCCIAKLCEDHCQAGPDNVAGVTGRQTIGG